MRKILTVCFTGHRNVGQPSELKEALINQIEQLIKEGARVFLSGMARGWDLLCAATILELKKEYPKIELWLILPCSVDEQTKGWCESDIDEYNHISAFSDKVEQCSDHYYNGCMKARNQRLIDLADCCICYYNTNDFRSGTGQTVRMAERKKIRIINLF